MSEEKSLEPVVVDPRQKVEKLESSKDGDAASEEIVTSFVIRRSMKFYPITDSEFENLSYVNTLFNVLLAAGPLLAGVGITSLLSLFTISKSDQPTAFGAYGATGILSVIGAAVVLLFAARIYKQRKDLLSKWQKTATPAKS